MTRHGMEVYRSVVEMSTGSLGRTAALEPVVLTGVLHSRLHQEDDIVTPRKIDIYGWNA